MLDISTGKENLLLKDGPAEVIGHPAWSPVGDRMAFTARAGLKEQLDLIQADGSGRQSLFAKGNEEQVGFILGLVWAPDGKSLWFHDNHHLHQISDTGALLGKIPLQTIKGKPGKVGVIVSGGDRFLPNPTDPQLLAFTKQVEAPKAHDRAFPDELPGISALFLYDSRSKTRTRLTPKDMWASHPCWSRDGQYLYFSGYRQPHYQEEDPFRIYRISRDGKDPKEITRGRAPSL
jgi:Tol biopolymer transport system component